MAEILIEYRGAGCIPPYPGEYGNCRVIFDADTLQALRIEPLTALEEVPTEPQSEEANQGG